MKNLKLIASLLVLISKPIIRIYLRNNRLMVKILCIIVFSVDYQLLRYVFEKVMNAMSKKSQ
jgi:hypothetical protein